MEDSEWTSILNSAYFRIDREYPVANVYSKEIYEDVIRLIRIVYDNISLDISVLRDKQVQHDLRMRTAHYIYGRIIRLGVYLNKRHKSDDEEFYVAALKEALSVYLLIEDHELFASILQLSRRICVYISSKSGAVGDQPKARVRKFAERNSHRCCFCGAHLDYSNKSAPNSFEVEHLFPQSYGGGQNRENIGASCNRCNKIKNDRMSHVDFYCESLSIVSDDIGRFQDQFRPDVIMALLLNQSGKCFHCNQGFFATDRAVLFVTRREGVTIFTIEICTLRAKTAVI